MSDIMFFSTIKDEKVSKTEMRFLRIGSAFVWLGIIVLVVSGLGLFMTNSEGYLASSKFLAKVSIVSIIILNGIFFHISHLPRIKRHVDHHFPSSDEFMRHRPLLLSSGAVSFVSWTSAIILGGLKSVPYSYRAIMLGYLVAVSVAILIAQVLFKHRPLK